MSKRSIKDFFSVIQDENSGSNDEERKLLDRIAWPCRQTSTAHPDEKEINVESVLDQFAQHKERRLALCL